MKGGSNLENILTGFSIRDITPPLGTELCGHGVYPERKSTGVLEPLYTRAMAWKKGNSNGVLVMCDLLGISKRHVAAVREAVFKRCGLPPENVMISCLHNHSGPTAVDILAHGEENGEYIEELRNRIVGAVEDAVAAMEPTNFEYSEVPVDGIAYNREYEGGKTDPRLRMLTIKSNGRLKGFIANYSCHPVVINIGTSLVSSDFIGAAVNRVMEKHKVMGMFLQGSCGDINSIYVNNPQTEAIFQLKDLHEKFMVFLEKALENTAPVQVSEIKTVNREVTLPLEKLSRQLVLRYIRMVERMMEVENLPLDIRKQLLFEKTAFDEIWKLYDIKDGDKRITEMQAFRFGDIIIASHPAELFYSFQEKVMDEMKPYKVMLAGYSNDFIGYIPGEDRYDVSGRRYSYPAHYVPLAFKSLPYVPNIGGIYAEELLRTIRMTIGGY